MIADLDLSIGRDEHLAVVGPSGAGKSTLVNLLAGLLPPDSGRVLLLGRRLTAIPAHVLPRTRALIPQEAYVFAGTVRENLAYLWPDATEAEMLEAAERVGAAELVKALGGLNARIVPGPLSAGQRQLLALTRAYLSPAPVVLLDEATCHLDHAAERKAEAAFRHRPGAIVLVAHAHAVRRRAPEL